MDAPVSNSGKLSGLILQCAQEYHVAVKTQIIPDVDRVLERLEGVVSGDTIILNRCRSWLNIMPAIIERIVIDTTMMKRGKKSMDNEKVYAMSFAKIYPLLVSKAEKKGRTLEEVNEIICWLTGYHTEDIEKAVKESVSYGDFFQNAPQPNPNRKAIKGVVCKVRVETIKEPLMQEIRYLDKLIDELAKGKSMDKILRKNLSEYSEERTANGMWKCPKCGRTFKHTNQDHYCGEAPVTINEYIERQPEQVQIYLKQINETIKAAIPDTTEKISWSMPTYWKKHNLIQFAAFKKHIGLYPGPEAVQAFADRLKEYKTNKGAIQLPYNKPLPLELVAEIAKWCEKENG